MKYLNTLLRKATLALVAAASLGSLTAMADELPGGDVRREHRAIWMSPFLGSNWPSAAITASNAEGTKRVLTQRLDKFAAQGINVLYYHVRSMCDATYDSAYEPWSSNVSGRRGQAPVFDPFGFLVDEAHKHGIEVYAWVNPYRYCNASSYGEGELNYENSHPDWLLSIPSQTILNPALPEVRQRICDVIADILSKYDVDGVIFDDYFYSSGTPLTADQSFYQAYVQQAGAGAMSQLDWRRDNVNRMVSDVQATIKAAKPWVVFGISPAGTASPANVEANYGMPPGPYGDWQYDGIASDPLYWLKHQYIDFISPQIYWPGRYQALLKWWNQAAEKFGRHLYYSTDLSDFQTYKTQTFIDQITFARDQQIMGESGVVYFQYGTFVNNTYERYYDKNMSLGDNLAVDLFRNKAMTPLRRWDAEHRNPVTVTGVSVGADGALTWNAIDGMRYAIYAYDPAQGDPACHGFAPDYLQAIRYTARYEIPAARASWCWGVAAYDRYGYVYAPTFIGATVGTANPATALTPGQGDAPALFEFAWEGDADCYILEVSEQPDFATLIAQIETSAKRVNSSNVPVMVEGNTYYWRVRSLAANCTEALSDVASMRLTPIAITSPAASATEVPTEPVITWSKAATGAVYDLEVAFDRNFSNVVYAVSTEEASAQVPALTLQSGRTYYARVTASVGINRAVSAVSAFSTVNVTDYPAPTFVNPAADGLTLHSDDVIAVAPWSGMYSITVNISKTDAFPARTSFTGSLLGFETETVTLDNVKLGSARLVDGETYYLRARGTYYLTTTTSAQYTDYSPVYTFVYSSEAGVGAVEVATPAVTTEGLDIVITGTAAPVRIYDAQGQLVYSGKGHRTTMPAHGLYLVVLGTNVTKVAL